MTTIKNQCPLILALILVGINLRPTMAAIGPLLTLIHQDINYTYTLISLLTMLPVLTMGLAMFFGMRIAAKFGAYNCIAAALAIIGLSSFARLFAGDVLDLIITSITAGLGISIIQAIIPGIIKGRFAHQAPLLMGIYITAIMAGAALAAGSVGFVAEYTGSWRIALSCWSGLAAIAMAAWFAVREEINHHAINLSATAPSEFFAKRPRAWSLGIFFGLGTASYTCLLAWLPPFYVDQGWPFAHAGLLLAFLTTVEVISGLISPYLASFRLDRRPIMGVLLLMMIAGLTGLMLAPTLYPLLWTGLLGVGIGGIFPLSLIVSMDHLDSPLRAGKLTAFVQGIGYIIAAFSPLAAGYIKDIYSSFNEAWLMLIVVTVVMLLMTFRFSPRGYLREF